jgi:hypothetical protein
VETIGVELGVPWPNAFIGGLPWVFGTAAIVLSYPEYAGILI